ncbi:MAG: cobalamin biosynthesis protein CbiG [Ilumatobacteraceae bacterium]
MSDRRLFDRYVVVDWSANGRPKCGRDSIWIAVARRSGPVESCNPSTRRAAESIIADVLATGRDRTLVAVDASLGFPAGAAEWFGLEGDEPWRAMWDHLAGRLVDDERNRNDRFEVAAELNRRRAPGPFWGCPAGRSIDGLDPRKPHEHPLAEFRTVETVLRSDGFRPASVWQLLGAGSVGSQTLTVLPVLERVRRRGGAEVWPFSTGFDLPMIGPSEVVVAEIWPTVFPVDPGEHPVRDAAQVMSVARYLRSADERSDLGRWFRPPGASADIPSAVAEEGWLLRPP